MLVQVRDSWRLSTEEKVEVEEVIQMERRRRRKETGEERRGSGGREEERKEMVSLKEEVKSKVGSVFPPLVLLHCQVGELSVLLEAEEQSVDKRLEEQRLGLEERQGREREQLEERQVGEKGELVASRGRRRGSCWLDRYLECREGGAGGESAR